MTEKPYRILVADDDAQMRFLWRGALLKPVGAYHVVAAADGCEALEEMARANFDLVVTDLVMPGMDGLELTRTLRQLGYRVPVLWISGMAPLDVEEQAAHLEVHCCLRKPLRVAEIRRAVADALGAGQVAVSS